ncbi:high-affinity branched-chain amino acid transport system permease protein LivH [Halorhodospira halochloris]|uniref:High-affinity branched-chain amino acid transport system permease protein LivH n=1 Tax=Halorhodospira halochloris TaxID=1052 RepID=A0A0X8X9P8_HALHR|nr:branched-chain amino acid ABC transporter permease [Halorhodospira halochloris]MBK1652830.1 branched-chain amino acid ABC transporter permease [Halorhodospira halochloris]BAU58064.1 high-affinity branched-chain amino acid transport system permease protein LivH [Halorhodospira halochloris]
MFAEFLQYLLAGVTIGATYALIALGFTIIYNASHVINFAQGEMLMIGGMATVALFATGVPLALAIALAVLLAAILGMLLHRLAIAPARQADVVTLIIITIGAAIFLRGVAQIIWGRDYHSLPSFSQPSSIEVFGAVMYSQSLWVLGVASVVVALLAVFFMKTAVGRATLAVCMNKQAARLMGVRVEWVLTLAFVLAAALGAIAGAVATPITLTSYDIGVMLGLKGFVAAAIGGLGSGVGAIVGGLLLGISEAMTAGYLSSDYKDAVAFLLILVILMFMPRGLLGAREAERV